MKYVYLQEFELFNDVKIIIRGIYPTEKMYSLDFGGIRTKWEEHLLDYILDKFENTGNKIEEQIEILDDAITEEIEDENMPIDNIEEVQEEVKKVKRKYKKRSK